MGNCISKNLGRFCFKSQEDETVPAIESHFPLQPISSPTNELHMPAIENLAVAILQNHSGKELGQWELTGLIDECTSEPETNDPFEVLNQLTSLAEIREMPYHDQAETLRYFLRQYDEMAQQLQSQSQQFSDMGNLLTEALDEDEELQWLSSLIGPLFNNSDVFNSFLRVNRLGILMQIELVQMGLRLPVLQSLNALGPTFLTPAGENGYTMIFEGGTEHNISDIEEHLLTRNTTPPTRVESDVITLAISYKHKWRTEKRICQEDLEAISTFIKASHASKIRFWIDAKLPPTDDGSFERWLTRGLRPYARYMTLICPSAEASIHRFWVANERYTALAGRGIFVIQGQEIYFKKGIEDFRKLAKRMLTLVVGEQEVPPGVRDGEEGKVSQWALGILGSSHNAHAATSSGPVVDELQFADYSENTAMSQIDDVVRHYGPIALPLISGRTWNRENPLMKGNLGPQEHKMNEWIGLSSPEDKRTLYFLHTFMLHKVREPTNVALRVRLHDSYDSDSENFIEEKVLMEIPNAYLRKMLPLTVPTVCDWSVFSGEQ